MKLLAFLIVFVLLAFGPALFLSVMDARNKVKIEEIRSKERIELAKAARGISQ